jgi:hypothetical protein
MIEVWNRLIQGIWKRLLLVVNTLKEVVLPLCGVVPPSVSKIDVRKRLVTNVEASTETRIKTGDLVKTINYWEGWITLGIAYDWKDVPKHLCQFEPEEEYIYIQALNGEILMQPNCNPSMLGGYKLNSIKLLSSNTEQ